MAMLQECRKKGVYEEVHRAILGERLPFVDQQFDHLLCIGVFQPCGPSSRSLDEFVRVVKRGGLICFTHVSYVQYRNRLTGPDEEVGFLEKRKQLEKDQAWVQVYESEEKPFTPGQDPDTLYRTHIYRRT
eukprot:TRINITY_DN9528_c0_g1_i2.p1 TRINITY_DN9528_c0_g1~~TRINITY_DN9528_c0_g1_i2.p1  ORF type:complete len:130 (-),score=28.55 TRINITY_DN9528_c0_g1_i2:47-436(-)